MRASLDDKLFSADLIDDMHTAFETACAKLGLFPTSDKATELVATKIVELAKAGLKGEELAVETLRSFDAREPVQRDEREQPPQSISAS
jgi:hypothetical protein